MKLISNIIAAGDGNALNRLTDNLTSLLNQAYPYIISVIGALVVVWAVFIGLKWWQAGNQEKQREAKEYLKNFLIGLALIFVVGVVAVALIGFLGNWAETAMQ
ncbi:MAG: pilin [Clostridiales bacterium]|jgi:Mn2+/Fe2+ NRAMP family transporter|nr:pilin [Clostridiales bacterium]